jgi:hypothetical protein
VYLAYNGECRKTLCHNKDGADYVGKFRACVYVYEDEVEFENVFRDLKSILEGT